MLNTIGKIILFVFWTVISAACTSPLEKSVLEPLKSKELDRVAGKDKSFLATYSIVEEKWNYISTPEDSARWKGITYSRLHNYRCTIEGNALNAPLFTQLRGKWEDMYNNYSIQADSLIAQWKEYLAQNSPDSLLSVSYEGVEIERIRNAKKGIDTLIKAKITLVPRKFALDSVMLSYSINSPSDTSLIDSLSNIQLNTIRYKRKLTSPVITKVFLNLLPVTKSALLSNDSTLVFSHNIISVYSNGKCYNADSLKKDLPKSLFSYIDAEKSADEASFPVFDQEYYKEKIIKDLLNPDFISQSAYIKINAEHYYKELDSLVFNFIHFNPLQ